MLAQAAAWSTGRPAECAEPGGRGTNVWERAKAPALRRYCDPRGETRRRSSRGRPRRWRRRRSTRRPRPTRCCPAAPAPLVLEGRALAALGRLDRGDEGHAGRSRERDRAASTTRSRCVRGRACSRARAGTDDAAEAYRTLPAAQLGAVGSGAIVGGDGGGPGRDGARPGRSGRRGGGAARGLREAQEETPLGVLALALVLDRRGDVDEARALLASARARRRAGGARRAAREGRARRRSRRSDGHPRHGPGGRRTPRRLGRRGRSYCRAGARGPWAAHARAHVAALGSRRAPAGRGR